MKRALSTPGWPRLGSSGRGLGMASRGPGRGAGCQCGSELEHGGCVGMTELVVQLLSNIEVTVALAITDTNFGLWRENRTYSRIKQPVPMEWPMPW